MKVDWRPDFITEGTHEGADGPLPGLLFETDGGAYMVVDPDAPIRVDVARGEGRGTSGDFVFVLNLANHKVSIYCEKSAWRRKVKTGTFPGTIYGRALLAEFGYA